jgi:hypothetical protein
MFLPFVLLHFIDPNPLDLPNHVGITVKTFEEVGDLGRTVFDGCCWELLEVGCWGAWS